ncbi:exodeoxyribonuclease V subunit gamma [Marinicella sp. W31]|uniref:exodeoxyribonuclease V subunit gamma n=1 Tax=Marinicella sp. W31 TaxID=3023713 RepID=UPI0037576BB0
MIHLYTSPNSVELMHAFVSDLQNHKTDVFAENWVVVPNHACRNWVERQVAKRLGICSQLRFIQPGSLMWELTKLAKIDVSDKFRPQQMLWQLSGNKPIDLSLYKKTKTTATCLNNYVRERPEWIMQWEQKGAQHPHGVLWRELVADNDSTHLIDALNQLNVESIAEHLPASLQVFLPEQISPLLLRFLQRLSSKLVIYMYVVNPIPEDYWFKIATSVEMAQQRLRETETETQFDTPFYYTLDIGNPLLANLGRQKANLLDFLLEQDLIDLRDRPEYPQDTSESLLADVRQDIAEQRIQPQNFTSDESLQIHACHNRKREVEVIKDCILKQLAQDSSLQPYDVLVVAPDINDYAAAVAEVFTQKPAIHHHIDRLRLSDRENVRAFLSAIETYNGQMQQDDVYALLESASVRQHLGIEREDLSVIRRWLQEAHVLWGYDQNHRKKFQAEAIESNTWKQAKRRWLQGYMKGAYVADDDYLEVFGDHDGMEPLFTAVFNFIDTWYACYECMGESMALSAWYQWLNDVHNGLIGEMEPVLVQRLSDVFILKGDMDPVVSFAVMQQLVEEAIAEQNYRSVGEIGVRFQSWENACHAGCQVLAVLGMSDGAFPKQERKDVLDLTAYHPHPLSRNVNLRDKNLLLNALMEPLKQLIVSYQGFSPQDNSPLDPSSVVQQLIEYLKEKTDGEFTVTQHHMHGFNANYFADKETASFSSYHYNRLTGSIEPHISLNRIDAPETEIRTQIDLQALQKFIVDPQGFYIKEIVGIEAGVWTDVRDAYEMYQPQALDQWHINQLLLKNPQDTSILNKSEWIPQDVTGQITADKFRYERAGQLSLASELEQIDVQVLAETYTLNGPMSINENQELTTVLLTRLTTKEILRHWITHLAWQHQTGSKFSYLFALDRRLRFTFDAVAEPGLNAWVKLYQKAYSLPILFVPQCGFKLNKQLQICSLSEYRNILSRQTIYSGSGLAYLLSDCICHTEVEADIEKFLLPLVESATDL